MMSKTLNRILQEEKGFEFHNLITTSEFPERMVQLSVEMARGWYSDLRVVPSDVALDGSEWKLKEPAHLVYVKISRKHPDYAERNEPHVTLCLPVFVNKATGEENYHLPIHSV